MSYYVNDVGIFASMTGDLPSAQEENGWNGWLALCNRLLGRLALAWHELDAMRAHALLDEAEHTDHGWAAKADALHARLVPPDLDPDPLATVERLVAAKKAAEKAAGRSADDGPH